MFIPKFKDWLKTRKPKFKTIHERTELGELISNDYREVITTKKLLNLKTGEISVVVSSTWSNNKAFLDAILD